MEVEDYKPTDYKSEAVLSLVKSLGLGDNDIDVLLRIFSLSEASSVFCSARVERYSSSVTRSKPSIDVLVNFHSSYWVRPESRGSLTVDMKRILKDKGFPSTKLRSHEDSYSMNISKHNLNVDFHVDFYYDDKSLMPHRARECVSENICH